MSDAHRNLVLARNRAADATQELRDAIGEAIEAGMVVKTPFYFGDDPCEPLTGFRDGTLLFGNECVPADDLSYSQAMELAYYLLSFYEQDGDDKVQD